jgi:hypothetical protein
LRNDRSAPSDFVFDGWTRKGEKVRMTSKAIRWCWFVSTFLASGIVLITGCNHKDAELAAQREKELQSVRAELEQAKTASAAQELELTLLRKDHLELLKLRNEVRKLGDDKKQLSQQALTAQAQAQQAQAQIQVVQSQAQQAAQALAAQQQELAARNAAPLTGPQVIANACINQLRQIDGAMQQWALEYKKPANAIPTEKDIAPYLKGNMVPKCPGGGVYTIRSVAEVPTCSIPGHVLPQQ